MKQTHVSCTIIVLNSKNNIWMALAHVFVHITKGRQQNMDVLTSPSQVIKETKFGFANTRVMTKIKK